MFSIIRHARSVLRLAYFNSPRCACFTVYPLKLFSDFVITSSTNLSPHRLPSSLRTDSTDFTTGPFLLSISVLCF